MERVRYVQRVMKAGQLHLYFRKGDHREGPLKSVDGTPELKAEVDAILERLAAAGRAKTARPGTVGGMLELYKRSADFATKAPSTQVEYGRMADELTEDAGDVLLTDIDAAWLDDMMSAWALRGYKAANDRRQVLLNALRPAIRDKRVRENPFTSVEKLKRPKALGESHPFWEDDEVEAAIDWAIARKMPGLARAVALGRWGGFRRQTICALPVRARALTTGEDGRPELRLHWVTEKRLVVCDKREDPRLTALLERTPNRTITLAYNDRDQPWKKRALNQAITRMIDSLVQQGKARDGLTPHGLRHARGVELAMAGASDAEIMAQLEHATTHAAKIYRRQAERRRLADAGQDRVDTVVQLKAKRKAAAQTPKA